jgi:hypothetical protein
MNAGLLFVPLALFASASIWMRWVLVQVSPDLIDVETEFSEGLGLTGTFIMIGVVVLATLYILNLIA